MNTQASLSQYLAAQASIHPEHTETQFIVDYARKGGVFGWVSTFICVVMGFFWVHMTGLGGYISLPLYLVWWVAGIALSFAGAIIGMLIGVLWGKAHSQFNIWNNREYAINDAIEEINTRRRLRKVFTL